MTIDTDVKNIILCDETFWTNINAVKELLKPVAKWITILEGDDPQLSAVPAAFSDISDYISSKLTEAPFSEHEKFLITVLSERENRLY